MAETQLSILNAASVTTFVQVFGLAGGTVVMQSIPTNTSGNALLGTAVSANAMPVVIASDQANITAVLGAALPAGTNAIGTVSITGAIPAGTNAIGTVSVTGAIPAGTNAIGTVTALIPAGTNAIGTVSITGALPAGTNAIGTVSAIQVGSPWGSNITQIGGAALAFGAAASAASIPVVLATNQTAITVLNAAGTNAIGTVSALLLAGTNAIGTVTALLPAGTNAIGTVSITGALPGGANAIGTVTALVPAGTNAIGTVSAFQLGSPWGVNLTQINGTTLNIGSQASALCLPVVIASNQTSIPVSGSFTATLGSSPLTLFTVSATAGAPAATNIKSGATAYINSFNLYCNSTSYPVFLKLYNVSAAAVNSSVSPVWRVGVPPGSSVNPSIPNGGIAIGNACSVLVTKLAATNDTTAVAIDDLIGAIGYL